MKIAVLGAGAFGTALGQVLTENGTKVQYYDPAFSDVTLIEALSGAGMVLLAVPSATLSTVLPELPKDVPLIVATKGILDDRIFDDFSDVMILSGPGYAEDIKSHKPAVFTVSDTRLREIFAADYLKFDLSQDKKGILLCGALKNVYAIMAGLLDLEPGTTQHEEFLTDVAAEMKAVLEANGAKAETVDLSCGKGDLRLTCGVPSRNYEFGRAMRLGDSCLPGKTVEGVTVLGKIREGDLIVPESAKYLRDLLEKSEAWS